ncbi:MAG: metal-sensitive transcriptional regulator [Acidimicrobiales bacterium]|nr:metal-sensitive transcriptional regulator [Acidimicrobiales bacterium]
MDHPGYSENKTKVIKRLRRVQGQVKGIEKMVDDDRYCIDVLEQVSAATRALQGVALALMEDHLSHCVANAIKDGGYEADLKIKEAYLAIERLVKS